MLLSTAFCSPFWEGREVGRGKGRGGGGGGIQTSIYARVLVEEEEEAGKEGEEVESLVCLCV